MKNTALKFIANVLAESTDSGAHLRKPKQMPGGEGSEVVTFCYGLKLEQSPFVFLIDRIFAAKQNLHSPTLAKGGNNGGDTSALEKQIDEMVYALCGLTPDEIAIVEEKG